jgi:hypothetical protein
MNELAQYIGIAIAAFGILYFTFLWDKKEHMFLRLLGSFFFVSLLLLVPKVMLDHNEPCDFVLINQTTMQYDYICAGQQNTTPLIFHKSIQYFNRIFWGYVLIYLVYIFFLKNNEKLIQMVEKFKR